MSAVRFETTQYEASHGRKPRGRGVWVFVFAKGRPEELMWFSKLNTFGGAKAVATSMARRFGHSVVHVAP